MKQKVGIGVNRLGDARIVWVLEDLRDGRAWQDIALTGGRHGAHETGPV